MTKLATFYGTNMRPTSCVEFGTDSFAEQIIGLVPVPAIDCFQMKVFPKDFNSFLFRFSQNVINADFRLFKSDGSTYNQVSILSSAEGEKHNVGTILEYPRYGGYILDWEKVYNLYGTGDYQFVIFNVNYAQSLKSYPFTLEHDDIDLKNGTVQIDMSCTGTYDNFNYTLDNDQIRTYDVQNIDWKDSCRYEGRLLATEINEEIEEIEYSNGQKENYFGANVQFYDLIIFQSNFELYKRLINYGLNANSVKLTSDNLDKEHVFTKLNVMKTGKYEATKFVNNRNLYQIAIELKDQFTNQHKFCK